MTRMCRPIIFVIFFSCIMTAPSIIACSKEIKKTAVTAEKVQSMCMALYNMAQKDTFNPELLIGISRGGLVPLGFLAGERMFNNRNTKIINIHSYNYQEQQSDINLFFPLHTEDLQKFESILVVDDLVDSGKSIDFVINMLKKEVPATIKTATLFYKKRSTIKPDYYVEETEDWIVFPWEVE